MTIFQISAAIVTAAALCGYINYRFLKLPSTIGHMMIALGLSLLVMLSGKTGWFDLDSIRDVVSHIDFSEIVLHGMLSFLLFAGALHINLNDLRNVRFPVAILATVGVVMATFITGTLTWWAAGLVGVHLPYIYALLFGALISPTDPIAVLSILSEAKIPKALHMKIGGESLFNDGVGVVVFLSILGIAGTSEGFQLEEFALTFLHDALGGIILGLLLGWVTFRLMRSIDDYKTEIMLTLALVIGGYVFAEFLHVSAPLCMVVAGLIIGNQGREFAMSEKTREHVDMFWELIDEMLNDVLFLLIGLEMMIILFSLSTLILGLMVIGAVLLARFISVALPLSFMGLRQEFERGTIPILTWGGLRGGLSIAMALSLPAVAEKSIILTLTYIVVLFSILVQGLSFKKVLKFILK